MVLTRWYGDSEEDDDITSEAGDDDNVEKEAEDADDVVGNDEDQMLFGK